MSELLVVLFDILAGIIAALRVEKQEIIIPPDVTPDKPVEDKPVDTKPVDPPTPEHKRPPVAVSSTTCGLYEYVELDKPLGRMESIVLSWAFKGLDSNKFPNEDGWLMAIMGKTREARWRRVTVGSAGGVARTTLSWRLRTA